MRGEVRFITLLYRRSIRFKLYIRYFVTKIIIDPERILPFFFFFFFLQINLLDRSLFRKIKFSQIDSTRKILNRAGRNLFFRISRKEKKRWIKSWKDGCMKEQAHAARKKRGRERKRKKQFKIVGPVIPNGRQRTMGG